MDRLQSDAANADQVAYWNGRAGERWASQQAVQDTIFIPVTELLIEHEDLVGIGESERLPWRLRPKIRKIRGGEKDVEAPAGRHVESNVRDPARVVSNHRANQARVVDRARDCLGRRSR